MDTIFQIEPKRFPFFLRAFVSREPSMVPEGHGIVELSFSFDGGVSKIFVTLSNGGARALPAWMRNTRDLFELCGRPANHEDEEPEPPPKEPTEEGLKRYADGRYEGIACVCAFDCEESCKGEGWLRCLRPCLRRILRNTLLIHSRGPRQSDRQSATREILAT